MRSMRPASTAEKRKLDGLMSQWTSPCAWTCAMASSCCVGAISTRHGDCDESAHHLTGKGGEVSQRQLRDASDLLSQKLQAQILVILRAAPSEHHRDARMPCRGLLAIEDIATGFWRTP